MTAPTVLILVSGGIVQGTSSTGPVEIIVQDLDNYDREKPENLCTYNEPPDIISPDELQQLIRDNCKK